ncbi:hypothetical protein [Mycolicibacterium mageritense]|uniref:hypothetical protein n=1 Tax=Mycolicibacterium mageritense TaxID=53462 RepID=UPI001E5F97FB|nr:hypothetical protein [Mycolicibacterium mageritense]MCC9184825.1 hypothetical protein [Mycolicibacterium mageritense]
MTASRTSPDTTRVPDGERFLVDLDRALPAYRAMLSSFYTHPMVPDEYTDLYQLIASELELNPATRRLIAQVTVALTRHWLIASAATVDVIERAESALSAPCADCGDNHCGWHEVDFAHQARDLIPELIAILRNHLPDATEPTATHERREP